MKRIFFYVVLVSFILVAACQKKVVSQNPVDCLALANTKWKLVQLNEDTLLAGLTKDITLQFDTAKVNGYAGCNSFFGMYRATSTSISFENMGSTKMFCQSAMQLEDNYLKALQTVNTYRIDKKHLYLSLNKKDLAVFELIQ